MELRVSKNTRPSTGKKISSDEVKHFYNQQDDQIMSFNNQLDLFYENCLENSLENSVVRFFHTQMLEPNDFDLFQSNFTQIKQRLFNKQQSRIMRNYRKSLRKIESSNESDENKQLRFKSREDYKNKRIESYEHQKLLSLKEAMDKDNRIYIGYRATFELQLHKCSLSMDEHKIAKIVSFLESKLIYKQLWNWVNDEKFSTITIEKMSDKKIKTDDFLSKIKSFGIE